MEGHSINVQILPAFVSCGVIEAGKQRHEKLCKSVDDLKRRTMIPSLTSSYMIWGERNTGSLNEGPLFTAATAQTTS